MAYVIQVCGQLARKLSAKINVSGDSYQETCMTYTIAVYTVKNS